MALHELNLQQNAIDVAISQHSQHLAVLGRTQVTIHKYEVTSKLVKPPRVLAEHPLPESCEAPVQVAWRGEQEIFVLTHDAGLNRDAIYLLNTETSSWTSVDVGMGHTASLFSSQNYNELYIQNSLGLVVAAPPDTKDKLEPSSIKLPVLCPWVETVTIADEVSCFPAC